MNIIVTGAIGIGKTTVCQRVIEIAGSQGFACDGVITYKNSGGDIVIQNVRTGETKTLASTRSIYSGPCTAKYCFNPEGIEFGIKAINSGISADISVVDELGHLELRGQGFTAVIEQVAAGQFRNCILVIRKELLPAFLSRLKVETTIFEATLENRNQLPGKIGLALRQPAGAQSP